MAKRQPLKGVRLWPVLSSTCRTTAEWFTTPGISKLCGPRGCCSIERARSTSE
jgi:hypothetical protein